ncbi:MAG: FAD-dependent oxidoreductase [Lactobacillales bacterium]|nr:FAD-dependent oxidoreductase [Lactobacillales bacterium]
MKVAIVGGSHAAIACAWRLREEDPSVEVEMFERKDQVSFVSQTIPLFLMGRADICHQANYTNPAELTMEGINVHINTEVSKIDISGKTLTAKTKDDKFSKEYTFDKLVMATGSYPNLPPTGGELNKTLFLLKNFEDAFSTEEFLKNAKHVIVVGGGLVGVEMARIIRNRKIEVTIIQSNEYVLDRYLDPEVAEHIEKQLELEGIKVLLHTRATHYETHKSGFMKKPSITVTTDKGDTLTGDGVIMSVGLHPDSYLVSGQLTLGDRGAILVDEYMHASKEDVFAIGDCSTTYLNLLDENIYNPHASDAIRQGEIAALNILGFDRKIAPTQGTYKFNMERYFIATTGITKKDAVANGYNVDSVMCTNTYLNSDLYSAMNLVYEHGSHKILGFQVLGSVDISPYVNIVSLAIDQGMSIEDIEFTDFYFEHGYKNPLGFARILAKMVRQKVKADEAE